MLFSLKAESKNNYEECQQAKLIENLADTAIAELNLQNDDNTYHHAFIGACRSFKLAKFDYSDEQLRQRAEQALIAYQDELQNIDHFSQLYREYIQELLSPPSVKQSRSLDNPPPKQSTYFLSMHSEAKPRGRARSAAFDGDEDFSAFQTKSF